MQRIQRIKSGQEPVLKQLSMSIAHFKVVDEAQGIIECIPSVFEVRDSYNERTKPGCFVKSLARKLPVICWMHDWKNPVGKTLAARELAPGDPLLPDAIKSLGGLYCKGQFNLKTQRGKEAFEDLLFGTVDEFSIGYYEEETARAKDGSIDILSVDLVEWSPVLRGANPATVLMGIKNRQNRQGEPQTKDARFLGEAALKAAGERCPGFKAEYLGQYATGSATFSAIYDLWYSLCYGPIYDCVYDNDQSLEDAVATLTGAFDEFRDISIAIFKAIIGAGATADEIASEMRALLDAPATKEDNHTDSASLRAGEAFEQQIQAALAAVEGCVERGTAIAELRAKKGRSLSEERRAQLAGVKDALDHLLTLLPTATKTAADETADARALQALTLKQIERKARLRAALTESPLASAGE